MPEGRKDASCASRAFHTAQDESDKALAGARFAESLIAQNKTLEATKAMGDFMSLLPVLGIGDRLDVLTAAARVKAASSNTQGALADLQSIINEAHRQGLYGVELRARLAHGEIKVRSGEKPSGYALLEGLEKEAEARGYALIARNARLARNGSL